MWPFRKKAEPALPSFWITESYPGIVRREDGSLEISLTEGELESVQRHLDMMNAFVKEESGRGEVLIHPEAAKMLEAQGLWLHAGDILLPHQFDRSVVIEKEDAIGAIAALTKAYALCAFPVILRDIGKVFKMSGNRELEVRLRREFRERDKEFQHTWLYEKFLEWRQGIEGPLGE